MAKISVGILGATGAVGQRFVQLLENHPWFEVTALAASDQSSGKEYSQACRWLLPTPIPDFARRMVVQDVEPRLDCQVVFSALPSNVAGPVEERFAQAGYVVCSNASAHRMDALVPLLIPEVNPGHTALIEAQKKQRNWPGFIVTNPNCSSTQIAVALKPLYDRFGIRRMAVVTLQAISGAGYPGLAALDILENVIPYIGDEEDKIEREPHKMLGTLRGDRIEPAVFLTSAQVNRVPVRDGHTACISLEFDAKPGVEEVITALEEFQPPEEVAALPTTPQRPIVVHRQVDRPQPARDRDLGEGMTVSVGRVRSCALFDMKFVVLGHNTILGAAGCAIWNAELLVAQKWIA